MQVSVKSSHSRRRLTHDVRLAELAYDLGIARDQKPAWEAFAEASQMIARSLSRGHIRSGSQANERPPQMPEALSEHSRKLVTEIAAVESLEKTVNVLYQSLSPRQRSRADRLLPALWCDFGWDIRVDGT